MLKYFPWFVFKKEEHLSVVFLVTNLNGCVPPPLLRGRSGGFSWFWLVRFEFLLWHLHHGIFRFVQLSSLLSGAFLPPSHLRTRTWGTKVLNVRLFRCFFFLSWRLCLCEHLHAFDATHASSTVVGRIHRRPLFLRHTILIIRLL